MHACERVADTACQFVRIIRKYIGCKTGEVLCCKRKVLVTRTSPHKQISHVTMND